MITLRKVEENGKVARLMRCAVEVFRIPQEEIVSLSRKREVVNIRRMMFQIMRRKFLMDYGRIGSFFGRDHSTVLFCVRKHKDFLETEQHYIESFARLNSEYEKCNGTPEEAR